VSSAGAADPLRAEGALLGAAVGDALGWPQENRSAIVGGNAARRVQPALRFRDWERNPGGQFRAYRQPVPAGTYSDDTQLLLAVARACLRGEDWQHWLRDVELPFWPAYERGGGGAVLRASRAWADGRAPWAAGNARTKASAEAYFRAGANGVAMRIAPHAVVTASRRTAEPLLERCLQDGLLTHGHPRALVGAVVYAVGLRAALNGSATVGYGHFVEAALDEPLWRDADWFARTVPPDWHSARQQAAGDDVRAAWSAAARETEDLLRVAHDALGRGSMANDERTLDEIGCFGKQGGSGTITAAAALYVAARSAARPPSGLLRTAYLPSADTDTLASMTAAVLGAVHGTHWLGGLDRTVQDADYIRRTARDLAAPTIGHDRADGDRSVTTASVKRFLGQLHGPGPTALPDGRDGAVTQVLRLSGSGRTSALQFLVAAGDGQTLAFDIVSKRPPPGPGSAPLPFPEPEDAAAPGPGGTAQESPSDPAPADAPGTTRPEQQPPPADEVPDRPVGLVETRLVAADVDRSAYFYLHVLGLPGHRHGGALLIDGGLVLHETASPTPSAGAVFCVLACDDVEAAAARLRHSKYRELLVSAEHGNLRVEDPDGHRLQIVPRRAATPRPQTAAADRHVVPAGNGGWDVIEPRSDRTSAHALTQKKAVDRAREVVRNAGGGEVVIHDRNGRIRGAHTVPPRDD
jgi:ADP-ribosylglycohydrolase